MLDNKKLTDDELMEITGGEAFLDSANSVSDNIIMRPLYAVGPIIEPPIHLLYAIPPIISQH